MISYYSMRKGIDVVARRQAMRDFVGSLAWGVRVNREMFFGNAFGGLIMSRLNHPWSRVFMTRSERSSMGVTM